MASPPASPSSPDPHRDRDEEAELASDARFREAVDLFNRGEWYACHDGFEELWHETAGPCRPVLQGILQIAVAHLHLERQNRRGATVLIGEGLGRLRDCGDRALGLDLDLLRRLTSDRLALLQLGQTIDSLPLPRLEWLASA